MENRNRGVWVVATLTMCLAVLCLAALADGEERQASLVGTIVEVDWDDNGDVIAVELETDETTYTVASSGKGRELLNLAGQRVEVRGTISEDEYGWDVIHVTSFTVVSSDEL